MQTAIVENVEAVETSNPVIWVITNRTKDHGDKFVVRRQIPHADRIYIEKSCAVFDSLEEARGHLPPGLIYLPRDTNDDAVIVEMWL